MNFRTLNRPVVRADWWVMDAIDVTADLDGAVITGIILVTVGAMAMLPRLLAWSDGASLRLSHLTPGITAQVCGCLVATQFVAGARALLLVAAAWIAVSAAISEYPTLGSTRGS